MASSTLIEKLALNAPHFTAKHFIPALLYGTAWKKEATSELVYQALNNGFTGIDTACQPKHYQEDLVGVGLRRALSEGKLKRSDIYVQTKYTPLSGQDPDRVPYDPTSSITEQVKASVAVSLKNLQTSSHDDKSSAANNSEEASSYLDALVLHSPLKTIDETMEAWTALESFVPQQIHHLGISNCTIHTLMDIYSRASIKPSVVQNRFYPNTRFDIGLRKFCRDNGIVYQSFWTLTANPGLVYSAEVGALANTLGISTQAALYAMVLGLGGTVILDGTKRVKVMREDHAALEKVRGFVDEHPGEWEKLMDGFRALIGETR